MNRWTFILILNVTSDWWGFEECIYVTETLFFALIVNTVDISFTHGNGVSWAYKGKNLYIYIYGKLLCTPGVP